MENRKLKVLLIEDSIDDAELIRRKLADAANTRFQVAIARKLDDGLEMAGKDEPDLILSDLGLPDSHGLDTVTKILLALPHIPLVVLSGFDDEDIAIKAVQSGAQDYLVKGRIDNSQLERSLYYSIERARLQRELEQNTQEMSRLHVNLLKILENSADAILVVGEEGRIMFTNPAVESLFGRKPKELLRQPFDYPLVVGETSEIEIHCADERTNIAEMSVVNIAWEGRPAYLVTMYNITERKRMENAIRESEEKFSKAFHSSANLFFISRLDDGKFIEINDAFTRMTGYTRKEVIGHNATELNFWGDEKEYKRILKKTRANKRVRNEQIRVRSKSGEIRTGLFSSEQITIGGEACFINAITDITELKKAEESLRASEEKFSKAFMNSPQAILITNLDNGVILEANDTFLLLTGFSRADILGKKAIELDLWTSPEEREEIIRILNEQGIVKNRERQFRNKSGELRTWLFSAEIINIENTPCMLSVTIDITERKRTEEKLCFSDTALKSIHEGIFAMDNDYKITRWNEICEQIFGIKASDAIGKHVSDVVHMVEEYPGKNEERLNLLIEKGFYKEEQIYRTPRGDVWVEVLVQAIEANGKRTEWVTLVTDISERKKAEEALKQSEEKYRELINTSNDGIVSIDQQMKIIVWNRGAQNIFGYTEEEMLGQSAMIIFPAEVQKDVAREFIQIKKTGTSTVTNRVFETNVLKKDCSLVPVDISISTRKTGDNHIVTAIMRDITERKMAREKLRESEERYRDLFENASDLIQSCNMEGKFVYVNRAWRDALGYSEKEVPNLTFQDIIHPDYLAHCGQTLQRVMSGETVNNVETVFVAKDGRLIQVEGNVDPVRKEGKVVATRAIFRDINVRKEAEEKLRKIDQMKSEFLSNVSHELRTPLQSISGFTKLIMNGQVPDPSIQQEFLQIIDRETMHLGNLINGLLDMSRLEAGRFQIYKKLIPMYEIFTDSIKMFHSLAREKDITLEEHIPARLPKMEVDSERMRQVVINLLSNAVKFSDPGSSVNVKVGLRDGELLFQVIDHGTGIRKKAMTHLFERFYRVEGETVRGGTGLGLYISKQIIDAHGGHIWAESKFGEGSTFSFTLPLNNKGGNNHGKENTDN